MAIILINTRLIICKIVFETAVHIVNSFIAYITAVVAMKTT